MVVQTFDSSFVECNSFDFFDASVVCSYPHYHYLEHLEVADEVVVVGEVVPGHYDGAAGFAADQSEVRTVVT